MFIFKVLAFLWPFLREMILEKKTLGEALKTNKKKVLLIFVILASLGMNLFFIPKLVQISEDFIKLRQQNTLLQANVTDLTSKYAACSVAPVKPAETPKVPELPAGVVQPTPIPSTPSTPKKKPTTKPISPPNSTDRYGDLMDQMRKLQHREEERTR